MMSRMDALVAETRNGRDALVAPARAGRCMDYQGWGRGIKHGLQMTDFSRRQDDGGSVAATGRDDGCVVPAQEIF